MTENLRSLRDLERADWADGELTDDDIEYNNRVRAGWAAGAVLTMARETRLLSTCNNEDIDTAIGDLLGNLAHLCDLTGLNFADLIEHGLAHYHYETEEP